MLVVEQLVKDFEVRDAAMRAHTVRAVDGVSFTVEPGETFAVVGESGSGKSTLGRLVLRLEEPTEGRIAVRGRAIEALKEDALRPMRRQMQIVFQDPLGAFDPRMRIEDSIREYLALRPELGREDYAGEIEALIGQVGLDASLARRYPRELSGGQLQRMNVARALAPRPELLFLDEPTAALDVSIRGQIVNLLLDRQEEAGLTYLLVTHDLQVARFMAARVAVMYLGQFVEVTTKQRCFQRPLHPYTRGLIGAAQLDGERRRPVRLRGELRAEDSGRRGCRLASRCPFAEARCEEPQELRELEPGHLVRCWKALDIE